MQVVGKLMVVTPTSPELVMNNSVSTHELISRITSLGFNEKAATKVVDFLGERVYPGVKESTIKRRDVRSKDPA